MSRSVTLGNQEWPLGEFTLGQVSRLAVLLKQIDDASTVPQVSARETAIYLGLQSGGYTGSFEEFQQIKGVLAPQLSVAQLEIGYAIGYYVEKAAAPGEAPGEESPSPS